MSEKRLGHKLIKISDQRDINQCF